MLIIKNMDLISKTNLLWSKKIVTLTVFLICNYLYIISNHAIFFGVNFEKKSVIYTKIYIIIYILYVKSNLFHEHIYIILI